MIGKQIGAHAQTGHTAKLGGVGHLAMLQCMPVVPAGIFGQHGLQRVHGDLGRLVAVRVDMNRQARLVVLHEQLPNCWGAMIHMPFGAPL